MGMEHIYMGMKVILVDKGNNTHVENVENVEIDKVQAWERKNQQQWNFMWGLIKEQPYFYDDFESLCGCGFDTQIQNTHMHSSRL